MNSYIEKEALSRLCTINGSFFPIDRGFFKHTKQDIIQMPPIIISVLTIFFITINLEIYYTYLHSRFIIFQTLAFVKCFDCFCLRHARLRVPVGAAVKSKIRHTQRVYLILMALAVMIDTMHPDAPSRERLSVRFIRSYT